MSILIFELNFLTLNNVKNTYFSHYSLDQIERLGNITDFKLLIYQNENSAFFHCGQCLH